MSGRPVLTLRKGQLDLFNHLRPSPAAPREAAPNLPLRQAAPRGAVGQERVAPSIRYRRAFDRLYGQQAQP